jgi:hypothetical protein
MNNDTIPRVFSDPTPLEDLTRMCTTMFAEAFKLPFGQNILARLLRQFARGTARHALEFDHLAGDNLQVPSRYLVDVMSAGLTVHGVEHVPSHGPVLVTCNHPGVFDAMAVFASLPRTDVKVIARPRNLLDVLPNIRRHLIFVPDEGGPSTLRAALRYLDSGGLLVTFPRGAIEPDPLLHLQTAEASVERWSPSFKLLAKHIPNLTIIPAAVGGVISTRARNTWLARRYSEDSERDWFAATLQLMLPAYRDVHPVVVYGKPVAADDVQSATRCLTTRRHSQSDTALPAA